MGVDRTTYRCPDRRRARRRAAERKQNGRRGSDEDSEGRAARAQPDPDADGVPAKPSDDEAIAEALEQISTIDAGEDDRRKTTDAKLGPAQSAIGFIVTLASGSVALAFLQTPVYDLWHALVITALLVSVGFFVWAAVKIAAANDPTAYQARTASGVRRMLYDGKTKRELQLDAIDDLVSNVRNNGAVNNQRLTLYRAAIENIEKGVIAAACVPVVVVLGYLANAFCGAHLPTMLRLASPVVGAAPSAAPPPRGSAVPARVAHRAPAAAAGRASTPPSKVANR